MASTPVIKHTWTQSIKNDSGAAVMADPPLIILGDSEANAGIQVPANTTIEIDITVAFANIVSFFFTLDQGGTVNTNASDGTGGNTFTLVAGVSKSWNNTITGVTNPITINITKIFVHNSSSTKTANFKAGILTKDATT